ANRQARVSHPLGRRSCRPSRSRGCGVRTRADRLYPRLGPLGILAAALLIVGAVLLRPIPPARAAGEYGGALPGLSPDELGRFEAGAALFSKVHGPEDGLGPVF